MSGQPRRSYLVPAPEGAHRPSALMHAGYIWVLREDGLYHDVVRRHVHGSPIHPRSLGWFVEHGYTPYPTTAA